MPDGRPLCQTLCPNLDREITVKRGARFQKSPGKDAKTHHRVISNFKVNIYSQHFSLSMRAQDLGNGVQNVSSAAAWTLGNDSTNV